MGRSDYEKSEKSAKNLRNVLKEAGVEDPDVRVVNDYDVVVKLSSTQADIVTEIINDL